MSTVTLHDRHLEDASSEAAIPTRQTFFCRLLTWYKAAVTEPESEREKADWQQTSF